MTSTCTTAKPRFAKLKVFADILGWIFTVGIMLVMVGLFLGPAILSTIADNSGSQHSNSGTHSSHSSSIDSW